MMSHNWLGGVLSHEWYGETIEEIWLKLKDVKYRVSGKKIFIQPFTNSDQESEPICRKIIGEYKLLSYKTWGGNGGGYDSKLFIWNTKTNEVKRTNERFSNIVKRLNELLGKQCDK